MNHLDLFSGILGFAWAAHQVWGDDYKLIATCEIDPFCQKIIKARTSEGRLGEQNRNVPIISDIRDVTHERILADTERGDGNGGKCESKRETKGRTTPDGDGETRSGTIDLLTGGFPCQPFSCAGKRQGDRDDRFLWPQMLRVIREIQPTWIIGENVAGIINMALDQVLADLESAGYQCQTFLIPACGVDAPHRRDRVWIVANRKRMGRTTGAEQGIQPEIEKSKRQESEHFCTDIPEIQDVAGQKRREDISGGSEKVNGANWLPEPNVGRVAPRLSTWLDEPDIPRVATGVKDRVNRLKSLGNAIVPQCVIPIMQAIKENDL